MILIIDNYDSFTYNLVHLIAVKTDDYKVIRNDALTVEEIKALNPSKILISPGPGRPADAGVTEDVIREMGKTTPILGDKLKLEQAPAVDFRRLFRTSGNWRSFWSRCCIRPKFNAWKNLASGTRWTFHF